MEHSDFQEILQQYDSKWIQRQRVCNTKQIFDILSESGYTKKGVEHVLHTRQVKCTPAALCKAKQRLPPDSFDDIRKQITIKWGRDSHVYAIDGSKIYVPSSFVNYGFSSRTNNKDVKRKAVRPIAMLSSMVDVHTGLCVDYILTKHFNERKSASSHLAYLQQGDTVIFDRGYFSSSLYNQFVTSGVHVVFRLKCDACLSVKKFVQSTRTDQVVQTVVSGQFIKVRLLKYWVENHMYVIGTSLLDVIPKRIAFLYKKRWTVELHFRRLKSTFCINYSFCIKEDTWRHTVQARVLADTVSLLLVGDGRPLERFIKYIHTLKRTRFDVISEFLDIYVTCLSPLKTSSKNGRKNTDSRTRYAALLLHVDCPLYLVLTQKSKSRVVPTTAT